ncbi:MAG: PDZ domain-containing protein [Planctomycetota bacterium]
MHIRSTLFCLLVVLFAREAPAQEAPGDKAEPQINEKLLVEIRGMLGERKKSEQKRQLDAILARDDLDWPTVKKALKEGPYYVQPNAIEFGERNSHRAWGLTYKGEDEGHRLFSVYVPKGYKWARGEEAKRLPVLLYLHNKASNRTGDTFGDIVIPRFAKHCDERGFLLVTPSTNAGCEWWTPEGKKFVRWTLDQVRRLYSIDEDHVALVGAHDGGNAVWLLAQEMPDTFSCLVTLTASPVYTAAMYRPLYLGTLDRMDVLMGIGGRNHGGRNLQQMLAAIKPMVDHRMNITAALWPSAQNDIRYFNAMVPQMVSFCMSHKRNPVAKEVDIQTDFEQGQRSLWIKCGPIATGAPSAENFKDSIYKWPKIKREEPKPRMGIGLEDHKLGVRLKNSQGTAQRNGVLAGDILLELNGQPMPNHEAVKEFMKERKFKDDIKIKVAREIYVDDLERMQREQRRYLKRRARLVKARKEGREDLDIDDVEDVDDDEGDEDDDGCSEMEGSLEEGVIDENDPDSRGGAGGGAMRKAGGSRPKQFIRFTRWMRLRRPQGALVRADFGAGANREYRKKNGVKLANVVPGGFAWRQGFRNGDLIVGVGGEAVKNVRDVNRYLRKEKFQFEKEEDSALAFDIQRPAAGGKIEEKSIIVEWKQRPSARVDVQYNAQDYILDVKTLNAASFTIFFNDDMIPSGKPLRLFVNGVPYQDLVDPAGAPDYPVPIGSDPDDRERRRELRLERSKIEGWNPDPRWAIEYYMKYRDRSQVFGGYRTWDVTIWKDAFEAAKARREKNRTARKGRLQGAEELSGDG